MGPHGAPGPIPEGPYTYSLGVWTPNSSITLAYPLKIKVFTIFKYFLGPDDDDDHPGYPTPLPALRTQEKNMA